jgi:hypothetical protein
MSKELVTQTTPHFLLTQAIEKGVDIQQLKELMDLQERWEKKEAKKSFLSALSKFQTLIPILRKNKKATINSQKGNFSYNYADLGGITQSIKKPLNECGLSYRWEFEESNDKMKVTCLISHLDGHTETTFMEAGKDMSGAKNDIQQKGSTQTYLQRYTLIGALGLSTADEDNDAKNSKPSYNKQGIQDMDEAEALDLWKQTVGQAKTKIELQSLYLKNRKAVDSSEKIKSIFKSRESILNGSDNKKVSMP